MLLAVDIDEAGFDHAEAINGFPFVPMVDKGAGQATLVMIKPDAIKRGLTGAVLSRLDELGLEVIGAKALRVSRQLAEEHYHQLRQQPFFEDLIKHLCGTLHQVNFVLAFVYCGPGAMTKVRQLAGATNPEAAEPTSIRGALGRLTTSGVMENVLHASSDQQEAEREIKLWFRPEELLRPLYPTRTQEVPNAKIVVWAS